MKNTLITATIALFALGILMIYMGLNKGIMINPPVVSGVGFLVIGIVFGALSKQK